MRESPRFPEPGAPLEEPGGHHLNLRFEGRLPINGAKATRRKKWQGFVALLRLEEADDRGRRVLPGLGREMVEERRGDRMDGDSGGEAIGHPPRPRVF